MKVKLRYSDGTYKIIDRQLHSRETYPEGYNYIEYLGSRIIVDTFHNESALILDKRQSKHTIRAQVYKTTSSYRKNFYVNPDGGYSEGVALSKSIKLSDVSVGYEYPIRFRCNMFEEMKGTEREPVQEEFIKGLIEAPVKMIMKLEDRELTVRETFYKIFKVHLVPPLVQLMISRSITAVEVENEPK